MRIVLLGATGFLGQHLVHELSQRGHQCAVVSRTPGRHKQLLLVPRVELIFPQEFTAEHFVEEFRKADACINLVGILNESGRNGKGFERVHVGAVQQILEACQRSGLRRVVQVSALNAGKGDSHYLISKGEAEDLLRQADWVDATIVQPSVIFGDGDSFFNRFASLLRIIPVFYLPCADARLQPVWVGDVVAAIGEVLQRPDTIDKTLELAGPKVYTLRELVAFTAKAIGRRRLIIGLPNWIARIQAMVMDFIPGKPFSSDNFKSLQIDNIAQHNALPELGIKPRFIDPIVTSYITGSKRQKRLDEWRRSANTL